jgi:hypothetical protein
MGIDGLLRRFAPLRKRFAFVAGNDGGEAFRHQSEQRFKRLCCCKTVIGRRKDRGM